MKKNVILLGGSNSIMVNVLQKGLRDTIATGGGGLDFYNLALGANDSLHKFFAINKNEKLCREAELIVIETNINDYDLFHYGKSFEKLALYMTLLCKKLASFNAKIVFIMLPFQVRQANDENDVKKKKLVENFLRKNINHFGFNCVDMGAYYDKFNLLEFFTKIDIYHQAGSIMRILGKNIIKNIANFRFHTQKTEFKSEFLILSAKELFKENLESKKLENSIFNELIYKLYSDIKLKFDENFKGYQLLGLALCNFFEECEKEPYSSFILENTEQKVIKFIRSAFYLFHSLNADFTIDENSFMYFNKENLAQSEGSVWIKKGDKLINNINHCGLSYFFLAKIAKEDKEFELKEPDEEVKLLQELDFSHLSPEVEDYKELIEQYCFHMEKLKEKEFQDKINELNSQLLTLQKENSSLKEILSSQEHKAKMLKLSFLEEKVKSKELKNKILEKELGRKDIPRK